MRNNYLFYEDDALEDPVVELFDRIVWETPKAYLFGDNDDQTANVWLPKLREVTVEKLENGYEVTVPYWLAKKKGMI